MEKRRIFYRVRAEDLVVCFADKGSSCWEEGGAIVAPPLSIVTSPNNWAYRVKNEII